MNIEFTMNIISKMVKYNRTNPEQAPRRERVIRRYQQALNQSAEQAVGREEYHPHLCRKAYEELSREFPCVVYVGVEAEKARPRDERYAYRFSVLTENGWDARSFRIFTGGTTPKFCY